MCFEKLLVVHGVKKRNFQKAKDEKLAEKRMAANEREKSDYFLKTFHMEKS